ncbi:MAG: MjaI family restriction endonuclease [Firmicutes bacterium]|nr:MjaI family restriction endonuclease [Bacillota bacterium]
MKKITISAGEMIELSGGKAVDFPKYTTQIINLANQNSQATRPRNVGQLSELFPQYAQKASNPDIAGWKKWYCKKYPHAVEKATDRIMTALENINTALHLIDRKMVQAWVEDLIYNKTFRGLDIQEVILKKLANIQGEPYRAAKPHEEAQGIDGYVGNRPYSVKPMTYKTKDMLSETLRAKVIYYEENSKGLTVEIEG